MKEQNYIAYWYKDGKDGFRYENFERFSYKRISTVREKLEVRKTCAIGYTGRKELTMMYTKLWKVRVNNWGWDFPEEKYARSRFECEKIAETFPASDRVEYAGKFTEKHAREILNNQDEEDYIPFN